MFDPSYLARVSTAVHLDRLRDAGAARDTRRLLCEARRSDRAQRAQPLVPDAFERLVVRLSSD